MLMLEAKWSCQKRHIFSWVRRVVALTMRFAHQVLSFRRSSGSCAALPDLPGPFEPVPLTVTSFSTAPIWP